LLTKKFDSIPIPARLSTGDTIGIVAPAGPFDQATFDRGVGSLKDLGFEIFVPSGVLDADRYLANTDQQRAQFINQLFADKGVDAIICARGGYGSIRVLPLLDYQAIADNPKVFIGFSDITVLLNVLADRCGLVTFHGPVVTSLADASAESSQSLVQAVSSGVKLEIKGAGRVAANSGSGSGIVCGGNLTTLCHLVGTSYAPNFAGKILFLEDRGEAPYRIDRMLVHMKLAGCFENLAGIALGSFENCGPSDGIYHIVGDIFKDESFPIVAGLDVGHGKHNLTLPLGIEATLDANDFTLSYHQAATMSIEDR
jgi:muramoyltetrapeptide carboxypeptidase